MNNKKTTLRPPTDEEVKELFRGIVQENRDHGHIPPKRVKCNDCTHRILGTAKCNLLYPQGIPNEIIFNREICKEFKQK